MAISPLGAPSGQLPSPGANTFDTCFLRRTNLVQIGVELGQNRWGDTGNTVNEISCYPLVKPSRGEFCGSTGETKTIPFRGPSTNKERTSFGRSGRSQEVDIYSWGEVTTATTGQPPREGLLVGDRWTTPSSSPLLGQTPRKGPPFVPCFFLLSELLCPKPRASRSLQCDPPPRELPFIV